MAPPPTDWLEEGRQDRWPTRCRSTGSRWSSGCRSVRIAGIAVPADRDRVGRARRAVMVMLPSASTVPVPPVSNASAVAQFGEGRDFAGAAGAEGDVSAAPPPTVMVKRLPGDDRALRQQVGRRDRCRPSGRARSSAQSAECRRSRCRCRRWCWSAPACRPRPESSLRCRSQAAGVGGVDRGDDLRRRHAGGDGDGGAVDA